MSHTFLVRPGRWRVEGRVFDAQSRPSRIGGDLQINHQSFEWILRSALQIDANPLPIEWLGTVEPFAGGTRARWRAIDSSLGTLEGRFEIAGKRIFSSFHSADQTWTGSDTLTQGDEITYQSQGELLRQGRVLASWTLVFRSAESR